MKLKYKSTRIALLLLTSFGMLVIFLMHMRIFTGFKELAVPDQQYSFAGLESTPAPSMVVPSSTTTTTGVTSPSSSTTTPAIAIPTRKVLPPTTPTPSIVSTTSYGTTSSSITNQVSNVSAFSTTSMASNVYPRVCNYSNPSEEITWVMFIGDSNMRHTYYWWVTNTKRYKGSNIGVKGSTFGLDRTDLDYGGRWADQELFLVPSEKETETIQRYSLRFLHGALSELALAAKNWDIAHVGSPSPSLDDITTFKTEFEANGTADEDNSIAIQDESHAFNWTGKLRPSEYALWATKHQTPIQDNSDQFNNLKKRWNKTSPDVVILTHGWGGVPASGDIEVVREILDQNPETLFIWAPVYVTNRKEERYREFVDSGIFQEKRSNLRMVDLWDLVKKNLPPDSKGLYHTGVGSQHMKESMARIWNAAMHCA